MEKSTLVFYNGVEAVSQELGDTLLPVSDEIINRIDKNLSEIMNESQQRHNERQFQTKLQLHQIVITT